MAKQTLWQKIRSLFRGDEKKSAPKPRQNRDARNETVSTRTSAPSYNRRALLNSLRDKKAEEEEKRVKNEAFKATKYDAKDIGESLKKTVKKDVPDPKQKILKERAEKREEEKKKRIEASAPYKKKIDEKYKTRKSGASAYVKTGNYAADPDVAKYNVLRHPVATSATRGAVSGASFGASEFAIKKNPWQTEEQREAEEFYQKNKNAKAEMAGEIVGSLASFGGTAKATDRLGEKVIEKAAPRAAEKLAGTKLIQNAAKKSVTKAVEKGAVKSASKELIEQVGKDRAKKIVNAVGNDVVQNATTGLLYDFNKASAQYEIGSPEWWREMGQSAAFNAAITGVVGAGSAFTGGKRLVKEAAENLTPRYKVGLNRRRRGDVVLPNERPSAAISEAEIDDALIESATTVEDFMNFFGLDRATAEILAKDKARGAAREVAEREASFNPFFDDFDVARDAAGERISKGNIKPLAENLRTNKELPRSKNREWRAMPRSAKRVDTSIEGVTKQLDELKGRTWKTDRERRAIETKINDVEDRLNRAKWRREGGADMDAMQKAYRGEYAGFDMGKYTNSYQSDVLEGKIKGKTATIVEMSPDEYIERTYRQIFKKPSERADAFSRLAETQKNVDEYTKAMQNGEQFPLPYLDYSTAQQEGRHRAFAAKAAGIDKMPVVIIDDEANPRAIIEEVSEATAKANNWMDSLADSETYDDFVKQNAKNTDLKAHMKETGKAPKEIWRDARIERGKQNLRRISDEEADRILYEKIPENEIQGWFNDANSGYKPRILERMAESPDTVNASLNVAYKNYLDSNPKNALPFDEWLDTPQTLYRGVRSQTKTADDIFSAFTPYKEEVAKKFAGKTGSIEEISITPRETYGSVMHNLESEFLVPESAIKETATPAPKSEGFERYAERTAKQERMMQEGGEKADAIRAELANKPAKGAKPAAERLKSKDVDQFAGIKEDVSDMGFDAESEKLYQAANDVDTGKSSFDKLKDEAYKQSGTGLSTDGKEQMTAGEAREFFDSEWRTTQEHTKRGFSTIAVTGDKGFKGIAHDALKNGETVIDVYHDKENLAAGAQRVMSKADQEGGINQMIKDFNDYASNKLRLTENERRDQIYDCIAAVDFANANKDQPWSGELFLAACRAGAEQTSGSGLSLHMWHKMAMSSPAHRAKAVREQILDMFNRSAGMRKALNKGKGDKIKIDELDDVLKKNPALQKVLEELDNMDAATSKDEVERVASRALLHARKAMPMTVLDQLTQWRYVAMLSSQKTHIRNITSNIYSATLGQLRDAIASSAEENLIKGKGKYGKKFQEAVDAGKIDESNYHKSAGGLSWKAFSDSHTGTKSGFTLNRLNSKLEKTRLELEATSAKDATKIERLNSRIKDLEARQKEAQKAYDKAIAKLERGEAKKALDSWNGMGKEKLVANAEKWERRQYNGTVSKGVFKMNDEMSNFIGNALETSDALSLERIYREKFDKILTANDWSGLSKKAAGGDQEAAAALKQLEEYASQEAAYTAALDTYRNYNALSSAMNKFVNDSLFNYDAPIYKKALGAGLHAIMPFTKVPVNLLKRGIDYSPVGLMTAKRNLTRAIESGNITEINRACERLAEGKIGTGIVALGAGLGFVDPDGDLITGRLHDADYIDKKKKDAGYQNYSVTLGDHNFTLDWATPTAASLFTGVEFGRMLRHAFDQMASNEGLQFNFWKAFDAPLILASTTLEPTLQLGVFQGINDTLESVVKSDNYDDSGTNVNPALKIVASIAGNYVNSQISPAILNQLSRSFSPYDYFVTGETDAEYAFTQQLAKTPLAGKYLGAKTNVWGQIKNEKTDAGDYAKAAAKNLLSPANINKVTWDETDEWAKEFYEKTGYQGAFPKNNYNKTVEVGRIKGAHTLEMTKKEMAEYNVQRGKSGEDAMRDALNTVVFNRYDKDSQGHRTIAHADNISPEEREKIAKQFAGKGIKEVVDYIRKTPQFKKATVAEQKQILDAIYGASGGDDDQAKGAKRSAQRYIAGKKGISANEYDYYNETPRRVQESLQEAINSGLITYEQALDFTRNAGKTYYTTDERGEKGGTVTTNYNKKEMMEYLSKKGYSYEEAEALYNAYKQANAKDFNGIDLSSGSGYRRRGYGGYRHYGGGGRKVKVPALKQSSYKATKRTYKDTAATLKTSSSRSKGLSTSPVKVEPPKVKFKKYEV